MTTKRVLAVAVLLACGFVYIPLLVAAVKWIYQTIVSFWGIG